MKTPTDIQPLADLLHAEQQARLVRDGLTLALHAHNYAVSVKIGKKFARVDVGGSGHLMVELETGAIFGIKAYGVVHRGHQYGTLDTINDWYWGEYYPMKRKAVAA